VIGLVLFLVIQAGLNSLSGFSLSQPTTDVFVQAQSSIGVFPWQTLLYGILFVFYGWMVLLIVLSWVYNYYIIELKNIIIRKGIIFSKEERFNMEQLQSVSVRQGLFGKIFNYGTIELHNPEMDKKVFLRSIPDPYQEAAFIEKFYPGADVVRILNKGSTQQSGGANKKN
jgi:uncharacterized membrane protein YdbT with pleckstrin-like domain